MRTVKDKQIEIILDYINRNPKCRQVDLIDDTRLPKGSVAKLVSELKHAGQIKTPADGRYVIQRDGMNYWLRQPWRACA